MNHRSGLRRAFAALEVLALLVFLPLYGAALAGKPLGQYAELPPRTRYVPHAGFSWLAFVALAALTLLVVVPFVLRVVRSPVRDPQSPIPNPFPWWGWVGLGLGAVAWALAWTRFAWFAPWQPFTFTPLWIAYILVVNALTFRRSGRCMLLDRTGYFLKLFPVSAGFWWFFEYLNRFVQNWHYVGISALSARQYFLFATLPFSTVLPAVLGTCELLGAYPRLTAGLDDFLPLRVRRPRPIAAAAFLLACAGLAGLAIWPNPLFPLLWLAPLVLIVSERVLRGERAAFAGLDRGDWRATVRLALAALLCGFFWEMWNFHSLAKWIYTVPYVNRFHLFEMPLLGYAGYLPFGLECAAVARMFLARDVQAENAGLSSVSRQRQP